MFFTKEEAMFLINVFENSVIKPTDPYASFNLQSITSIIAKIKVDQSIKKEDEAPK